MKGSIRWISGTTALGFCLALLLLASATNAAVLKLVERKDSRDGALVADAVAEAIGGASVGIGIQFADTVDPAGDPFLAAGSAGIRATFLIEPEGMEQEGDLACVSYEFSATGSVSVNSTDLAAAAVGTGGDFIPQTNADTGPPLEATVGFNLPVSIVLDPMGAAQAVFEAGPFVRNNNGAYAVQQAGLFLAAVGDDVELNLSSAAAFALLAGGGTTGETFSSLQAEVVDLLECISTPPAPANALNFTGLAVAVMVLLAIGWRMKLRQR